MTPFAHVAAGYLATQAIDLINPSLNFNTPGIIMTGIIAGNIPDLDFLFVKEKSLHRNTWTHAPIFWIVVLGILYFVLRQIGNQELLKYLLAFVLGLATHFLADWYAARTLDGGGIRIFYPFSKKHYGLLDLEKPKLKIKFTSIFDMFRQEFLEIYMENKFLFYSEVFLIILGSGVFLSRSLSVFLGIFQ